ncbi:MAG: hypothetical protein QN141_03275 [Armatimonadota bacterium]|nr:hypothetical protein [Armatimonadota bacterium]MDR7451365.1 hypothetical protein [Armatimonadota bacterium]MDR7466485.1 hypothetical protein [Armatimonadota bacterium]MDR7493207.1 hypothetical protein [Armatimonadota bacterium]MDR7499440.1 hypothetical protein [Armatimonadota bacterium]
MNGQRTGQEVVSRIGYAEQWLRRAKGQVAGGHLKRGVLTLVLADAEVRHAIEMAGLPPRPARPTVGVLPVLGLSLAAALVLGLARTAVAPAPGAVETGPPILRLSLSGDLLRPIAVPVKTAPAVGTAPDLRPTRPRVLSAARTVVPPPASAPRRPAPGTPVPASGRPSPPAVPPAATAPSADAAAPSPAPTAAPATVPAATTSPAGMILSSDDLIDLVLAAERALRGDPMRR